MTTRFSTLAIRLALIVLVAPFLHGWSPAQAAKSDCPSGYFCVWTGTNYSGGIQRISTTNSYRDISLSNTRSYFNNRSSRTWLHSDPDGGGYTACIDPRASRSTTSGWQASAQAAYLATITSC